MNQKMSRGPIEYMFQMSVAQLKTLLNEACVVDNACTFLLGDQSHRCRRTCRLTIFTNVMSFKVFDDFAWKHVGIELLSVWELIFYLLRTFCPHLGSFCVISSFTTFWPNFTSGLLQMILPRPRRGMLSLVTVFPVITAFHSCCLSHHVFDQINLWLAWVGFETTIWQCSPGTVETQRLYPMHQKRGAIDNNYGRQ